MFIFTSTNKVYGDTPNRLPLVELETRYELPEGARVVARDSGINVDRPEPAQPVRRLESLGRSASAGVRQVLRAEDRHVPRRLPDRAGHAGTELHGFLAYLMKCTVTGTPYRVFGYKGKQVRDNIHSSDLVVAFEHVAHIATHGSPSTTSAAGRERTARCSRQSALCEKIAGRELAWEYVDENRIGDHIWWISDVTAFRVDYPDWTPRYDLRGILEDIYEQNIERWRPCGRGPQVSSGRIA